MVAFSASGPGFLAHVRLGPERTNVALVASDAPKVAFGASDAPKATLGRWQVANERRELSGAPTGFRGPVAAAPSAPMPHWVRPTHRTPHWVRLTHPTPHWGAGDRSTTPDPR